MKNVTIQLTEDVPVDPEHGATAGRVYEDAVEHGVVRHGSIAYTIVSDKVEEVGVLRSEAVKIKG